MKKCLSIHFLLAVLIMALTILGVGRLLLWNRGDASGYDAEAAAENSNLVETLDFIIPLSEERRAGHADDGKTTILFLGGNPFADDLSEAGLAAQFGKAANAEVHVAAFPDSRVTCLSSSYDPSTPEGMDDIFNLFYVAYAISTEDFTGLSTVASMKQDPRFAESVRVLSELDFSTVDEIVILYDAVDYRTKAPLFNGDENDISSYAGALKRSLELITAKYPHIRLVFMSPPYEILRDESGAEINPAVTDLGHGPLAAYVSYGFTACSATATSYIDHFNGSVNAVNYKRFLSDDRHLNEAGRAVLTEHYRKKIPENDRAEYQPPGAQQ